MTRPGKSLAEADFRKLALSLEGASEGAHMGHPDFRVDGKIFATLWPDKGHGVLMLTREEQEVLVEAQPMTFRPVTGGWGLKGATQVYYQHSDEKTVLSALRLAWAAKVKPKEKPKAKRK